MSAHKPFVLCMVSAKLEIAETAIHTFQGHMNEYTIKHEPSLACTECNNGFQSEPYQYEKTNAFLQFLMSIKLKNAEIEYLVVAFLLVSPSQSSSTFFRNL